MTRGDRQGCNLPPEIGHRLVLWLNGSNCLQALHGTRQALLAGRRWVWEVDDLHASPRLLQMLEDELTGPEVLKRMIQYSYPVY